VLACLWWSDGQTVPLIMGAANNFYRSRELYYGGSTVVPFCPGRLRSSEAISRRKAPPPLKHLLTHSRIVGRVPKQKVPPTTLDCYVAIIRRVLQLRSTVVVGTKSRPFSSVLLHLTYIL
jgi:hypothetical protein